MTSTWELADRKEIRAFRLLTNQLLVIARGEIPTPGFEVDLQPSLLRIFPPQFVLVRRPLPGIFPQVVTPYEHTEIVPYPANQPTVKIHHAEGTDDVVIEDLDQQTAQFSYPAGTGEARTCPEGNDEATGFSANLSFDEAFANALAALPTPTDPGVDRLQRIEVLETAALIGGIAGFHHLLVRVCRSVT